MTCSLLTGNDLLEVLWGKALQPGADLEHLAAQCELLVEGDVDLLDACFAVLIAARKCRAVQGRGVERSAPRLILVDGGGSTSAAE